ncbi:MAG: hypothetical protein ACERKO_07245 [Acetanaerobacterium sp.]
MTDIKVWAVSLCVAAIAGAIMHMLVPNTSLQKMMRLVIAAFFLSCLISPVLMRLPELEVTVSGDASDSLEQVQSGLLAAVDGQLDSHMKNQVEALLDEMGIDAENISFEYNTADKNRISISQIDVLLVPEYAVREAEIREYISGQTGFQTVVAFTDAV